MKTKKNKPIGFMPGYSKTLALAWMLFSLVIGASAQSDPNLDIQLVANKVVKSTQGKESLLPGDKAKPGDVLQYTATYRNKTDGVLRKLAPTMPIPPGTELVAASAKPKAMYGTTDGIRYQPLPLKRKVKAADGSERIVNVPLSEYRALRWAPVDLAAGKTISVKMRTKVSPAEPSTATTTARTTTKAK